MPGEIPFYPIPITDADLAFPADVSALLPPMEAIPEEFTRFIAGQKRNEWLDKFNTLFFVRKVNIELVSKEGIDARTAWRHIKAIMGSFQPKHQHKEAGVAYLMSLWFKEVNIATEPEEKT